jgi:hypothetical protein
MARTFGTRRVWVRLGSLTLMFGSAYSCLLWMDAVGKVSGWIGLPQFADQIPGLQKKEGLWFSLMLALLILAALLLGFDKASPAKKFQSLDNCVVFTLSYAGRLLVCAFGTIALVILLHVIGLLLYRG